MLILPLFVMLACAACHHNAAPPRPVAAAKAEKFVGSEQCASCHPGEFQLHRSGRHAQAMRAASASALRALTPSPGTVPLAGYALAIQEGQLALTRTIQPTGPVPLSLALGSGKVGITFVALQGADTLLEARMSYFPAGRQWDTTPGQQNKRPGDTVFGRPKQGEEARRCLSCHAVTLPAAEITPEPRFYGVGCESCHGAGGPHVAAMRAGNKGGSLMEPLGRMASGSLNDLCGKCHRTLKDIDVQSPEGSQTHRFQPYALTRSRCRNKDGSVLSCLTCHAPHSDASTDRRVYEAVCLNCHRVDLHRVSASHPEFALQRKAEQINFCPVNAKSGCINCHMRERQSFPGLFWKGMVDHLISVPPKASALTTLRHN